MQRNQTLHYLNISYIRILIKETFGAADILGKNCDRVVFDIGGNNYRIICHFVFGQKQAHLFFVCWIGTHGAYTKLCNDHKQYSINLY